MKMKNLLYLIIIIATFSSFQKKKVKQTPAAAVQKKKVKKTLPATTKKVEPLQTLPVAIQKRIDSYKKMDKSEQPRSVIEYVYKGKKVYYVNMHCCDFFNEVYDSEGVLIGHPDGGITGRGDGKLPDFNKEKSNERIVWTAPE